MPPEQQVEAGTGAAAGGLSVLLVRAGTSAVAIPLAQVAETLRPLPIEPLAGAPPFLLGLAVVRGAAVPVLDLGALITGSRAPAVRRFVSLRTDARPLALAVEDVLGCRVLDAASFEALPAALQESAALDVVGAASALDARLLLLLQTSRRLLDATASALPPEPGGGS